MICNLKSKKAWERIAAIGMTALAALREIFDENAYARFLDRNRLPSSRQAYAAFLRESAHQRERRARCC